MGRHEARGRWGTRGEGQKTHLREREETLSDRNDILHLLNRLDAVLNDLGVLGPGRVEDVADALDVALGPVPVRLLHRLSSTNVLAYVNSTVATKRWGICGSGRRPLGRWTRIIMIRT